MLTQDAHAIAIIASKIIELSTRFNTRYGQHYTLKPGSPQEAWDLYDAIFAAQVELAKLFDPKALDNAYPRYGSWWERSDVMPPSIAQQLLVQAGQFIANCTYADENTPSDSRWIVFSCQCVMAGMLHPSTLMIAADDEQRRVV